jgi:hypothetical protein
MGTVCCKPNDDYNPQMGSGSKMNKPMSKYSSNMDTSDTYKNFHLSLDSKQHQAGA